MKVIDRFGIFDNQNKLLARCELYEDESIAIVGDDPDFVEHLKEMPLQSKDQPGRLLSFSDGKTFFYTLAEELYGKGFTTKKLP